jgi:cbb3-type cytochrome oxidase subunit 3
MHDANGLLTFQGWLLMSICGIALLALGCVLLAYLLVKFSAEDRNAMDREAQTVALSAPRGDDPVRCDDAHHQGVVSSVRLELERSSHRRPTASVQRLRAESREGRPAVPPAA